MGFELPIMELPRKDEGGGPAGVNDPDEEGGGGPAGVVEGFEAPKEKGLLPFFDFLSGVAGGLDENGTWKPDMAQSRIELPSFRWQPVLDISIIPKI